MLVQTFHEVRLQLVPPAWWGSPTPEMCDHISKVIALSRWIASQSINMVMLYSWQHMYGRQAYKLVVVQGPLSTLFAVLGRSTGYRHSQNQVITHDK